MKKLLILLVFTISVAGVSCKKPAGEGGQATITGKVHETNFSMVGGVYVENANYDAPDVDVYIIYGDETAYGNRIKTGPDGKFEFNYLRPGSYTIYVYSKDKDAAIAGNNYAPVTAVSKTVEISDKKGTVDAGTFEIYK